MALDLRVNLLRGGQVRGVLGERGRQPHATDETYLAGVGHEARHHAGKGTGLLEVYLHRLDLLKSLIVGEVGGGVGVGHKEVNVGVRLRRLGHYVAPRRDKLVASGDDEVDVLIHIRLRRRSRVRRGGVLLRLEHLPVGVRLDGLGERLIVALAPTTIVLGTADDHCHLKAGLLGSAIAGFTGRGTASRKRETACSCSASQAKRNGVPARNVRRHSFLPIQTSSPCLS